ncbi:MAG: hypothetical protein AAGG57_02955 [Pseudomonadota bacterium]
MDLPTLTLSLGVDIFLALRTLPDRLYQWIIEPRRIHSDVTFKPVRGLLSGSRSQVRPTMITRSRYRRARMISNTDEAQFNASEDGVWN